MTDDIVIKGKSKKKPNLALEPSCSLTYAMHDPGLTSCLFVLTISMSVKYLTPLLLTPLGILLKYYIEHPDLIPLQTVNSFSCFTLINIISSGN